MSHESALATQQHSNHVAAICEQFLDGQSYDRLRLVNETRFCLAQSAEAMLEVGKRLLVMKESEPHGSFVEIINSELGLDRKIANKMMTAAVKFLSPQLARQHKQFTKLGKSKIYALMIEDDDDLAALADGGTVAGLELDTIDRMSCRELKKALRDARADNDAKDAVIADKNKRIDAQATEAARIKKTPPDEVNATIRAEAERVCFEAEALLRAQVYEALMAVQSHANEHGIDVSAWCAGQINQLDNAILTTAAEVGVLIERTGSAPEWEPH